MPLLPEVDLEPMQPRERRFNRLHEEHFEAVRRYVWRRDPALADDVVAETFLVAWRRLEELPEDARPWLIGVARNIRLNARRSTRRQQALAVRLTEVGPEPAAPESSRERDAVRAALERLSPADQEVLLLSVWDDLDRTAIAAVFGCTKANVSLRLHRARRRFTAALVALGSGSDAPICHSLIPGGAPDAR
jgi:RNA polymerase sigma-70 factor (ECF subfamily)